MFDDYFTDVEPENEFTTWEPHPEFQKEFISLWDGWLSEKSLSKLDEVTETEWAKFNNFIFSISKDFTTGFVNFHTQTVEFPNCIKETFVDFEKSQEKTYSDFSNYIFPELDCMISEEWDFTYILWHKGHETLNAIKPYISKAALKHFSD